MRTVAVHQGAEAEAQGGIGGISYVDYLLGSCTGFSVI